MWNSNTFQPIVLVMLLVGGMMLAPAAIAEEKGTLEDQLFNELGDDDLLDGGLLDDLPAGQRSSDDVENQLLEELDEQLVDPLRGVRVDDANQVGSDVEFSAQEDDPLGQIGVRMRDVEQRLRQQQLSGETTEMQQAIVADLDTLLAALRKQLAQQRMQGSGSSGPSPSQRTQTSNNTRRPAGGEPGGGQSQQPASESTPGVREAEDARVKVEELDELMKEVWGHLPETAREQMRQSRVERFHPKYELLIEKIYRRMAQQQDRLR